MVELDLISHIFGTDSINIGIGEGEMKNSKLPLLYFAYFAYFRLLSIIKQNQPIS
jgi:hypothetical protein